MTELENEVAGLKDLHTTVGIMTEDIADLQRFTGIEQTPITTPEVSPQVEE